MVVAMIGRKRDQAGFRSPVPARCRPSVLDGEKSIIMMAFFFTMPIRG